MFYRRPKIQDVFTPRRAIVNKSMYVSRPVNERQLIRSVEGSLHTIISGESGSGKTWMYKKIAEDRHWDLFLGNFANASRYNSILYEIFNAMVPAGSMRKSEHQEQISAEVSALLAKGGGVAQRKYSVKLEENLEFAFSCGRSCAGERVALLVLDNLESIIEDENLLKELGNIILLLDDERYAKHRIKILLVGVPADVIDYYQNIPNLEPVGNRIQEIFHLQSLSEDQVLTFLQKGFNEQLRVGLSGSILKEWSLHAHYVTLGIAQRVHEYCLEVADYLENSNWVVQDDILEYADRMYMMQSIYRSYAVIEKCMNEKETKVGRRNQVLYALRNVTATTFEVSEIEDFVRQEFSHSTEGVTLGIGQILSELASDERRLLRKTYKSSMYRFSDPKYLMCLRLMLIKDDDGKTVTRKPLKR